MWRDRIQAIVQEAGLTSVDLAAGDESGRQIAWQCTRRPGGELRVQDRSDRPYVIASLTKSVFSTLVVQLASEGYFYLNEHVRNFVPGFHRGALRTITLRHLLTHTSGLPDMLPHNDELRSQHVDLARFAAETALQDPAFPPGSATSYCSMGFAVLEMVVRGVTGQRSADLLHDRIFGPLQMNQSWLGLPEDRADELMPTVVINELPVNQQQAEHWNWNSRYWRTFGAPWGGMISTADDLGQFLACLLRNGLSSTGQRVLGATVSETCRANQTQAMSSLPEADRLRRPWGLGWRLNWPDHSGCFSDFLPAVAYGHWGATGTLMWVNPVTRRWCVILTNRPFDQSQTAIQRVSNVIAGII